MEIPPSLRTLLLATALWHLPPSLVHASTVTVDSAKVTVNTRDLPDSAATVTVDSENVTVDTRDQDSDGDGLTNYEEAVTYGTNPRAVDSDGDGLHDFEEITVTGTDPKKSDTNGNGTTDADEDLDGDGIGNGRELHELATHPNRADSDGDGLTDTFKLTFSGTTAPLPLRVGDWIRLDFNRLGLAGTLKLIGTPPLGLKFNPLTGILEGKLSGKAGNSTLTLQSLNGRTVIRSIALPLPVTAFPSGLAGTFQGLLEDGDGIPAGMVSITVVAPGSWSGTLDLAGNATALAANGVFTLNPGDNTIDLVLPFPTAKTVNLRLNAASGLISGSHPQGTVRGFRLARGTELPALASLLTLVIEHGEQDGFSVPAGLGWATGTVSKTGTIALKGQLGDAKAFTTAPRLSATGQAIVWAKPYTNKRSWLGGIISIPRSGAGASAEALESGLCWNRAPDPTELSYPTGFGPIRAAEAVAAYTLPASATILANSLGLVQRTLPSLHIDGGGLPIDGAVIVLPAAFTLDDRFALVSLPNPSQALVPWTGSVVKATGGFKGTLTLPVSASAGIVGGAGAMTGVLLQGGVFAPAVGAGLVKIPVSGPRGSFRTAAVVIGDWPN